MKHIVFVMAGTVTHVHIADNSIADAAYAKVKEALGSYQRYSNSQDETVEFSTGDGLTTIRLEGLGAISIEDLEATEDTLVALEVRKARMSAKLSAALAPTI